MREAMSHEEFENYLTLLSRTLQLRSGQSEAIAEELRLHLEERLDELTDRGVDPKKAVNIALGEFGDATALANKFTEISRMKRRRVMMRSMVGGLCVAAAILAMVMTVWPQGETNFMSIAHAEFNESKEAGDGSATLMQADKANQETREKLNKSIDANFVEIPLNEFLKEMEKLTDVQFYLDAKSIDAVGITCDVPITFTLKKVPAELVLRLVFKNIDLSFYVDNGVVIVATKEELLQSLSVRMYDVKQLIGEGSCASIEQQGMMGGIPGMAMGRVLTQGDINGHTLGSMIQQVIVPETWKSNGVEYAHGTLAIYRGVLVVRQTEAVHQEIGKLLDQLREKLSEAKSQGTATLTATFVETPRQPKVNSEGGMMGGGMPGMSMGGGMAGGKPGMTGMLGMPPGGMRTGNAAPPKEAKPEK